jgi:N-acetylneuraminic acid mutarotase
MKKHLCSWLLIFATSWLWAQGTWTQQGSFPGGARYGSFSFTIGEKGYLGGGGNDQGVIYSDLWEYDPATDHWTKKADFPGGSIQFAAAFSIGQQGYVGTGIRGSYNWRQDMWAYDASSDSWRQLADFPGGYRYTAVGMSIGNKGYIGTGNYRAGPWVPATYLNDWWEFDPNTETWLQRANLPERGRCNATGIGLHNKGYVGSGTYYYDTRLSDWWEFDPLTNQWAQKADIPGLPRYAANSFSTGNQIYVASGYYYSFLTDMYAYNPSTDSWTNQVYSPITGRYVANTFSFSEKAYMALGAAEPGGYLTDEVWQFLSNNWQITCPADQSFCYQVSQQYQIPLISCSSGCSSVAYQYEITGATVRSGIGSDASGYFAVGTSQIIWTATDANQTVKTCTTKVEIGNPILVNIPPAFAVQPGGAPNTLYLGYGPGCLTLTAMASGGNLLNNDDYQYNWSNGGSSASTQVCLSTPGNTNYQVTITDSKSCTASATVQVQVIDVRCGNDGNKVLICKKADDPTKQNTLCISSNAVLSHLKNGATLGNCSTNSKVTTDGMMEESLPTAQIWKVFPTVNQGRFWISNESKQSKMIQINVRDSYGNLVLSKSTMWVTAKSPIELLLPSGSRGVFYVQLISNSTTESVRILVQ